MATQSTSPTPGAPHGPSRTPEDIIAELELVCTLPGFFYTFCLMVARSLWTTADEVADIDWDDRPNQQELSLLLGFLAKHTIDLNEVQTEDEVLDQASRASELLKELQLLLAVELLLREAHPEPNPQDQPTGISKAFGDWVNSGRGMVEPIFYGGEGAYDFQFLEMASLRYAADNQWISENVGTSLETFIGIAERLQSLMLQKLRRIEGSPPLQEMSKEVLSVMSFGIEDLPSINPRQFEDFIERFSFTPGKVNKEFKGIADFNAVHSRPIVVVGEGRYCLPILPNLPKSIYESPYYWMLGDNQYTDVGLSNRGDATESITQHLLIPIFGHGNVFKGVKVKTGKADITDIDVLAISGNKAVIAQCKSKKLTINARGGDAGRLRKDFVKAVQEAYDQALKGRIALVDQGYVLTDSTGNPIALPNKIDEVYILCVTGDYYPAVILQARGFLEKEDEDPYPVVLSVFDLDIVSHYLSDKYEFLYYLRQRSNHFIYFLADSEMAMLGFHLKNKLFPDESYRDISIDPGYAQLVEANFLSSRGNWPKSEGSERLFQTWRNQDFEQLVRDIKLAASRQPGLVIAEDLLFFMYDLAGDGADNFITLVKTLKSQTLQDGKRHVARVPIPRYRKGATFVSFPRPTRSTSHQVYEHETKAIASTQKYMSEADEWVILASIEGSPHRFDIFGHLKTPWHQDPEMDQFLKDHRGPGILMRPDGRTPSKNRTCPCGSGKKFKRCHGLLSPADASQPNEIPRRKPTGANQKARPR